MTLRETRGRVLKTFGAHTFGTLVTLADRILLVPIIYWLLPAQQANLWMVVRTAPSFMASADVGFGAEAGNRFIHAQRDGKGERVDRIMGEIYSTSRVAVSVFGIVITLAAVLVTLVFFRDMGRDAGLSALEGSVLVGLMVAYGAQINQTQITSAVFRGSGVEHRGLLYVHSFRVVEALAFMAAIYLQWGVLGGAAAYLAVRFGANIYLQFRKNEFAPWAVFSISLAKLSVFREMARPAIGFAVFPLAMALQQQTAVAALATVSGAAAAAALSVTQIYARMLNQIGLQLTRSIWPEMTRASKDATNLELFWSLHDKALGLTLAAGILMSTIMVLAGPAFIHVWTKGTVVVSHSSVGLLVAASLLAAAWNVSFSSRLSRSTHGPGTKRYLAHSLMGAALLFILLPLAPKTYYMEVASFIVAGMELLMFGSMLKDVSRERSVSAYAVLKRSASALVRNRV